MSTIRRRVLATALALAVPLLVAPPASAGYTTYWSTLTSSDCGSGDVASVAPSATKSRGNYGYNRRYTKIYANGGYWSWGAFYTSGSYHNATHSQPGAWASSFEVNYWATMQTNPFIQNLNGLTVGGAGCFQW